jgi:uncharacterized membrane-anchored protein
MVEDMPNIGHQIIHEHEELAEKLALVLYLLGIVSIVGIFLNIKKHAKSDIGFIHSLGDRNWGGLSWYTSWKFRYSSYGDKREDSASNKKKMQYQPMFLNKKMIKVILTTLYN